ncbi:MAG: allantoinase [Bryobacterales bacterium]|jgi:allantoinase|nr:allantoinase [Bryobacterales bacterium]
MSDLIVLPGIIDVHVHFNEPGRANWEGAATGSRALAAGGGTVFIDMPLNSTPCTVTAADFDRKREALEATSICDFALWGGLTPDSIPHMAELADRGVIGFKAFMCDSGLPEFPRADDLTLLEGMTEAARLGLPVAVHAESEEITRRLTNRLRAHGRNDAEAFLESRPVIAEVEAIRRAGVLARETGCKLHIVHISSGSGVAAALQARAEGADITLETCPHYLFFTEDDLRKIGPIAKCAPPLRSKAEQEALWAAVLGGQIDMIGSDHSPCPPEMKDRADFFEIWGGIAGVQSTLPVLLERGLPLHQIAALTSVNGARRFNIEDPGREDYVLIDPNGVTEVNEHTLLHRHRTSPYSGLKLRGAIRQTIRRGEVIYSDGEITARTNGRLIRPNA